VDTLNPVGPGLPRTWPAIATRPRTVTYPDERLKWTTTPNAIMSVGEAHALADAGALLVANQHHDSNVLLVIKAVSQPKGGANTIVTAPRRCAVNSAEALPVQIAVIGSAWARPVSRTWRGYWQRGWNAP
jgi:hypothetical protein